MNKTFFFLSQSLFCFFLVCFNLPDNLRWSIILLDQFLAFIPLRAYYQGLENKILFWTKTLKVKETFRTKALAWFLLK